MNPANQFMQPPLTDAARAADPRKRLLNAAELARAVGFSVWTIYRGMERGLYGVTLKFVADGPYLVSSVEWYEDWRRKAGQRRLQLKEQARAAAHRAGQAAKRVRRRA